MRLIDLTMLSPGEENGHATVEVEEWPVSVGDARYTGMVYGFEHWSMTGTYIDFPGHLAEFDDGSDAADYPIEKLCDVRAAVVHIDRENRPGRITRAELESAAPRPAGCEALVIHALGGKTYYEMGKPPVCLAKDAVEWIVESGVHLLLSDVYEDHSDPIGVFADLFAARVATICCPINLDRLDVPYVRLTCLFPRFAGVTQIPCRVIARVDE